MATGQQIAFQPTFTLVFAEHGIKNPSRGSEEFVVVDFPSVPLAIGYFKDCAQQIGKGFIGTENTEITLILI